METTHPASRDSAGWTPHLHALPGPLWVCLELRSPQLCALGRDSGLAPGPGGWQALSHDQETGGIGVYPTWAGRGAQLPHRLGKVGTLS